jgi:hypothetical protein
MKSFALLIAIAASACQLYASVQVGEKTTSKGPSMGTYATCYEESTGKLIGSQESRTAVLTSPDGRYHAYAESKAVASRTAESSEECQNTSKLFVAGPNSQNFHAVLVIKPLPERHGNDIGIVDWSPAGHYLLWLKAGGSGAPKLAEL